MYYDTIYFCWDFYNNTINGPCLLNMQYIVDINQRIEINLERWILVENEFCILYSISRNRNICMHVSYLIY